MTLLRAVLAMVAVEIKQAWRARQRRRAATKAQVKLDIAAQRKREEPWERRQRAFDEEQRRRAEADKRG